MYTGVNNGTLEKPVLNQFRRIRVRITDIANTHFYGDDPGDSMTNGSNGSTIFKQAAILRGNTGRVKNGPVFIRNIIIDGIAKSITNDRRKQNDN